MSFHGTKGEARGIIGEIELSNTHGSGGTSPILHGASSPGGAANHAKPSGETQIVGRLRAGIKTPRTRTDSLTRKYAASGSSK
jgi:hypothetical protein